MSSLSVNCPLLVPVCCQWPRFYCLLVRNQSFCSLIFCSLHWRQFRSLSFDFIYALFKRLKFNFLDRLTPSVLWAFHQLSPLFCFSFSSCQLKYVFSLIFVSLLLVSVSVALLVWFCPSPKLNCIEEKSTNPFLSTKVFKTDPVERVFNSPI